MIAENSGIEFITAPKEGIRLGGKTYRNGETIPERYRRRMEEPSRPHDPADDFRGRVPPNMGRSIIPHVYTFSGLMTTLSRAYRNPDESIQHMVENANMMLSDPAISGPLFARQKMVSLLNWHIEPEDSDSKELTAVAEELTKILNRTKRFVEYRRALQMAVWTGRHANQHKFGFHVDSRGNRSTIVRDWLPIDGDKLVFRYDDGSGEFDPDEVGVRVSPAHVKDDVFAGRWEVEYYAHGSAVFWEKWERERICLHKHFVQDAPYEQPDRGGSIHGLGIRNYLYWVWYQKQETMAKMMELVERSAMGFTVYYYEDGNHTSKEEMKKAAQEQAHTNVVLIPRSALTGDVNGIEQIPPNTQGIEVLRTMIDDYFGDQITRMILGQTLSTKAQATGLGSGLSDLHMDSLKQIVKYDSVNLEETLTEGLLKPLIKFNVPRYSQHDFWFRISTEAAIPREELEAIQMAYEMGCAINSSDILDRIGISQPGDSADALINPSIRLAQQQVEMQDMQIAMASQQAAAPPAEGVPNDEEPQQQEKSDESDEVTKIFGPILNKKVRYSAGEAGLPSPKPVPLEGLTSPSGRNRSPGIKEDFEAGRVPRAIHKAKDDSQGSFSLSHPEFYINGKLKENDEGGHDLHLEWMRNKTLLASGTSGNASSVGLMNDLIRHADDHNLHKVRAVASRNNDSMNGYNMWPKIGFDAKISAKSADHDTTLLGGLQQDENDNWIDLSEVGEDFRLTDDDLEETDTDEALLVHHKGYVFDPDVSPELREIAATNGWTHLSDFMKSPEGRRAWKQHGHSIKVEFDLRDGSPHRKHFDELSNRLARRTKSYSRSGDELEDALDEMYSKGPKGPKERPALYAEGEGGESLGFDYESHLAANPHDTGKRHEFANHLESKGDWDAAHRHREDALWYGTGSHMANTLKDKPHLQEALLKVHPSSHNVFDRLRTVNGRRRERILGEQDVVDAINEAHEVGHSIKSGGNVAAAYGYPASKTVVNAARDSAGHVHVGVNRAGAVGRMSDTTPVFGFPNNHLVADRARQWADERPSKLWKDWPDRISKELSALTGYDFSPQYVLGRGDMMEIVRDRRLPKKARQLAKHWHDHILSSNSWSALDIQGGGKAWKHRQTGEPDRYEEGLDNPIRIDEAELPPKVPPVKPIRIDEDTLSPSTEPKPQTWWGEGDRPTEKHLGGLPSGSTVGGWSKEDDGAGNIFWTRDRQARASSQFTSSDDVDFSDHTNPHERIDSVTQAFGMRFGDLGGDEARKFVTDASRRLGYVPNGVDDALDHLEQQQGQLEQVVTWAREQGLNPQSRNLVENARSAGTHLMKKAVEIGYKPESNDPQENLSGAMEHLSQRESSGSEALDSLMEMMGGKANFWVIAGSLLAFMWMSGAFGGRR